MEMIITLILLALVAVLGYFVWRSSTEAMQLRTRYAGVVDIDTAVTEAKRQLEGANRDRQVLIDQDNQRRAALDGEYKQALAKFQALKRELSLVEESTQDISFGLYKPHFNFQTPEEYKTAITRLRMRERILIQNGQAAVCPVNWRVGDSEKEGTRMVKQTVKLIVRAFNGECDAARADVSWNNITKMEERVKKSCEAMNKLSGVLQVTIKPDYLKLKLDELRLTHEYEEKKYQDREEQRRIREQIREEERAQKELEKAQTDAEAEEVRFEKALTKAREEATQATGVALEKLAQQISGFEAKLDEARKKKERAISRAQLTKSGFVYVISNVGSFGEKIYKIGMTRRLEPMERILELGGASVPFPFDLHVMLYSDNAPELEHSLHQHFAHRRVNMVNPRREFYHGIEIDEIETFAKAKGLSAQFIKEVEAREYRETVAKRSQAAMVVPAPDKLSPTLFGTAADMN